MIKLNERLRVRGLHDMKWGIKESKISWHGVIRVGIEKLKLRKFHTQKCGGFGALVDIKLYYYFPLIIFLLVEIISKLRYIVTIEEKINDSQIM